MKKIKDLWNFCLRHRKFSIGVIFFLGLVSIYLGYWYYSRINAETRYVVREVSTGTITTIVSGTGQVSALKQVSINAKTSGEVVYVGARDGDYVTASQTLIQLDTRDAKMALESAELSLAKAKELNDGGVESSNISTILTSINKYIVDSSEINEEMYDILNDYSVSTYKMELTDRGRDYYDQASKDYFVAREAYESAYKKYHSVNKDFGDTEISKLSSEVHASAQLLAQAIRSSKIFVDYVYNNTEATKRSSDLVADHDNLSTWSQTINSDISSLLSSSNNVKTTAYEIKSLELAVKQKQYAYQDCFVRAPFSGVVQIDVEKGETISGSIGTIVSSEKVATIALNEVDAVKVKIGQPVKLNFDAIEDLELEGRVSEIDVVGTVSQGVVSYDAKITFNTQDERIKSGMSVSADIIVGEKSKVVVVPNEAIKTLGEKNYVETLPVEIGVTSKRGVTYDGVVGKTFVVLGESDDNQTEVVSGLEVGNKIIAQTIAGLVTGAKETSSLMNLFRPNNSRSNRSTKGGPTGF